MACMRWMPAMAIECSIECSFSKNILHCRILYYLHMNMSMMRCTRPHASKARKITERKYTRYLHHSFQHEENCRYKRGNDTACVMLASSSAGSRLPWSSVSASRSTMNRWIWAVLRFTYHTVLHDPNLRSVRGMSSTFGFDRAPCIDAGNKALNVRICVRLLSCMHEIIGALMPGSWWPACCELEYLRGDDSDRNELLTKLDFIIFSISLYHDNLYDLHVNVGYCQWFYVYHQWEIIRRCTGCDLLE
jgi:hypothetical protein